MNLQHHTIAKAALAHRYFPHLHNKHVAVNHLMRWIRRCKPLYEELLQLGYTHHQRSFTPRQAERIIFFLGDPD